MADSDQELLLEDEEADINQNQSTKNAQSQSQNIEIKSSKNLFPVISGYIFDSYQNFKHFFRSYRTMLLIDVFCSAFSPNGIYNRSSWAFTGKLEFLSLCYHLFVKIYIAYFILAIEYRYSKSLLLRHY